jgi:hypothetical protein
MKEVTAVFALLGFWEGQEVCPHEYDAMVALLVAAKLDNSKLNKISTGS